MPDTPPKAGPAKKAHPAGFELRARPRPVTRLSRRALALGFAAMVAMVFGSLWWALALKPLRIAGGPELANTDAKPTDALAGLHGSYAELTRPRTEPAPAPLTTDSGRTVPQLSDSPSPTGAMVNPVAQQRDRDRQAAADSAVFFTVSARQTSVGLAAARASDTDTPALDAADHPPPDSDAAQNLPDRKKAFLDGKADPATESSQRLQRPHSPDVLSAGTIIPAALITGLNSDLPGPAIAQVTENVYDTVTGRTLLVPQGAKLLGRYDSAIAYGQSRVLVLWTRLVMPDGSSIGLDNLPAADTAGYAGLEDGVDQHSWRLLKGIAFSTLLGVGSELANDSQNAGSGSGNVTVAIRQSGDQSANQAGQRIAAKDLAVQPTLTVRPGFPVRIILTRSIILKPYGG